MKVRILSYNNGWLKIELSENEMIPRKTLCELNKLTFDRCIKFFRF